MKTLKSVLLIFISLNLISCAINTTKKTMFSENDLNFVSGYPDNFFIQVTGTTAFTNKRLKKPINWNINHLILESIEEMGFSQSVVHNEENQIDFSKGIDISGKFNPKKHIKELEGLVDKCQCEYLLLIAPNRVDDNLFGTNQWREGFGISRRYLMGTESTLLYFTLHVNIIEVQSMKSVYNDTVMEHKFIEDFENTKLHKLTYGDIAKLEKQMISLMKNALHKLFSKLSLKKTQ